MFVETSSSACQSQTFGKCDLTPLGKHTLMLIHSNILSCSLSVCLPFKCPKKAFKAMDESMIHGIK